MGWHGEMAWPRAMARLAGVAAAALVLAAGRYNVF
jgi:hypothetical protein